MSNSSTTRLVPGTILAPFILETLAHGALRVPTGGLVHLQFRRFAGCPVCNLHLRSFTRATEALVAAGIRTVAVFHSTAATMAPLQELDIAVVPDPERRWYERFGVEQSALAVAHPKVIGSAIAGLFVSHSNPFRGEGGQRGLPADFLVGAGGELLAVHYGRHAADHWSVAEVIELASGSPSSSRLHEATGLEATLGR